MRKTRRERPMTLLCVACESPCCDVSINRADQPGTLCRCMRSLYRFHVLEETNFMPTASGHTTAIRAKKVIGTSVKDTSGKKIGEIEDVVLDKQSNNIM